MINKGRKNICSDDIPRIIEDINEVEKKSQNEQHEIDLSLCNHYSIEDSNNISDEGCRHLARAKWDNLQSLNLSNYDLSVESS